MERQLIRAIEGYVRQTTGRSYLIEWSKLDWRELRELQRLLRDLDYEKQAAVSRARLNPWKR